MANPTKLLSKAKSQSFICWPLFPSRKFLSPLPLKRLKFLGPPPSLSFRNLAEKGSLVGPVCLAGEPEAAGEAPNPPVISRHTFGIFLALDLFVEVRFHFPSRGREWIREWRK